MATRLLGKHWHRVRADVAAGEMLPSLSRSYIHRLFESGRITVNGELSKPGYRLRVGDELKTDFKESELDQIPVIDMPILYEDDDVLVVDKPAGVISHSRGKFWDEPSVASFIRQKIAEKTGERAGIVHRLDRATSGVMICAKNATALAYLQKQFSERTVKKSYIAVCHGVFKEKHAVIDAPIARNMKKPTTFMVSKTGKPAQTEYEILKESPERSMVRFTPQTGRTHQLRVHSQFIGHPIIGDSFYGTDEDAPRLLLHAEKLEIKLPGDKRQSFVSKLPEEFHV